MLRGDVAGDAGAATSWRLVASELPLTGAENMAIDQALLESVAAGAMPVLRFYGWRPPCVSLGRNQPSRDAYDPGAAASAGVDIVRRPTGGGAVLHDRELTYSIAVPVGLLGGPRETYVRVHQALAAGLRILGIDAQVAPHVPRHRMTSPSHGVCFQAAAPGEILANGRKLVGSAQRCESRVILQHGSLLLDGSQDAVAHVLGVRRAGAQGGSPPVAAAGVALAPASTETTVASLLGSIPPWGELVSALRTGFEGALGVRLMAAALSDTESHRARELEARFRSEAWTWRR